MFRYKNAEEKKDKIKIIQLNQNAQVVIWTLIRYVITPIIDERVIESLLLFTVIFIIEVFSHALSTCSLSLNLE